MGQVIGTMPVTGSPLSVTVPHQPDPEQPALLVSAPSFLDELSAFVASVDRSTAILWGSQFLCWSLVVAFAMIWGLD